MEWKSIPRFNGLYLASDEGQIFSVRSNKILKSTNRGNGYYCVVISINGEERKYLTHRLIAETFIPNPDNLPVVNHKDENPSNNRADNLEWCTHEYNQNYGTCIQRRVANTEYKYGADNAKSKTVYQFDLEGNLLAEFGSVREAERKTEMSAKSIAKCCTGQLKQYAGYGWSYTKEYTYDSGIKTQFRKGAILQYDMQGNLIKRWTDPKELKANGYSQICVNRVCRGERGSYKGYVFRHEGGE